MFKTNQPNSDRSNDDPGNAKNKSEQHVIRTLDELSAWIDLQLVELEARHHDFETNRSVRGYYQR